MHGSIKKVFNYALVWGSSAKHYPQRCGVSHVLHDEDVVQIVKKKVANPDELRGRFRQQSNEPKV